jgi:hypothetical protein
LINNLADGRKLYLAYLAYLACGGELNVRRDTPLFPTACKKTGQLTVLQFDGVAHHDVGGTIL